MAKGNKNSNRSRRGASRTANRRLPTSPTKAMSSQMDLEDLIRMTDMRSVEDRRTYHQIASFARLWMFVAYHATLSQFQPLNLVLIIQICLRMSLFRLLMTFSSVFVVILVKRFSTLLKRPENPVRNAPVAHPSQTFNARSYLWVSSLVSVLLLSAVHLASLAVPLTPNLKKMQTMLMLLYSVSLLKMASNGKLLMPKKLVFILLPLLVLPAIKLHPLLLVILLLVLLLLI